MQTLPSPTVVWDHEDQHHLGSFILFLEIQNLRSTMGLLDPQLHFTKLSECFRVAFSLLNTWGEAGAGNVLGII